MIRKLDFLIFTCLFLYHLTDNNTLALSSIDTQIHSFWSNVLKDQRQILYLQENQITPTSSSLFRATFSDLCSTCVDVTQYAVSLWARKSSFASGWNTFFRLSNNEAYYTDFMFQKKIEKNYRSGSGWGIGRLLLISVGSGSTHTTFFYSETVSSSPGDIVDPLNVKDWLPFLWE